MGYWNTRGLRGKFLEELINMANSMYRKKGVALIQKIPTPITPLEIEKGTGRIKKAYFESKSTVDYIGVIQGIPVCFDAKETNTKSLPFKNIHEHQFEFMEDFEKQDGISFFIVYFKLYDKFYILPFKILKKYWEEGKNGKNKSIKYELFDKSLEIKSNNGYILDYIDTLKRFIECYDEYDVFGDFA